MSDELYHYGVKGMKWGVRRSERKTRKQARNVARGAQFLRKMGL